MELHKQLKELKNIESHRERRAHSRKIILESVAGRSYNEAKPSVFAVFFGRPALLAEGVFIALIALGGGYYLHHQSSENLVVQADEVQSAIQVKLDEVKYLLREPQPLTSDQAQKINDYLKEATAALNEAHKNLGDDKLGDSLEKMKAAEDSLSKIESAAKSVN